MNYPDKFFKFFIFALCTCVFALSFIFATLLSHLHHGYNLVCHKRGFTGYEAF